MATCSLVFQGKSCSRAGATSGHVVDETFQRKAERSDSGASIIWPDSCFVRGMLMGPDQRE